MADAAQLQPAALDAAEADTHAAPEAAPAHAHPAQETLFGRPIPFAAYTGVFIILAVTSLIEVILAETIPFDSWVRIPLLGGLSAMKAILVMAYYMHLKDDSKIFAAAIILPIAVGFVATMFLLAVPNTY
jgi:caa(3)-type oxidase subunit IV